jgi:hypothetical protein
MDGLELLTQAQTAGIQVETDGETLRITGPPTAKALAKQLIARKDDILSLLLPDPQDTREGPFEGKEARAFDPGDGRAHAAYIAQCSQCGGTRWGPTAPPVPETLRSGKQVMTERWGCLDCASQSGRKRESPLPQRL